MATGSEATDALVEECVWSVHGYQFKSFNKFYLIAKYSTYIDKTKAVQPKSDVGGSTKGETYEQEERRSRC
jgi:hypothetical protein